MLTTTMTVLLLWSMILWLGLVVLRSNEPVRREVSDEVLRQLFSRVDAPSRSTTWSGPRAKPGVG